MRYSNQDFDEQQAQTTKVNDYVAGAIDELADQIAVHIKAEAAYGNAQQTINGGEGRSFDNAQQIDNRH